MVPDSDGEGGPGVLRRGWAPSLRVRAAVLLLVGVLLVLNPLVGGLPDAVGLTGNAEYAAAEITPDGGEFSLSWVGEHDRSVRGVLASRGGLTLLDCYPGVLTSERCALESALVDGPVTVESEPTGWGGYTYHGRFYEQTVTARTANVTLALRPASAAAVLSNVSAPASNAPDGVRRAIETGTVSADPGLDSTGLVVERDGAYYVVVQTDGPRRDEPAGPVYTAASVLVGAGFIRAGKRRYDRWVDG
jgi:hypothetical protein